MPPKRDAAAFAGLRFADARELHRHLGQRLAELRKRRSFKQLELAEAAGIGLRQLQKLEGAQGGGSLESWLKLANALDVSLVELLQPSSATATGAGESATAYKVRSRAKLPATTDQLDTLLSIARRLDAETVEALIFFARKHK